MEISVKVFDKICRTCLCQSSNMQPLLTKLKGDDRYLLEILASVANLDMKFEDTLPKQVCNECQASICMADAFKRRCLESEAVLLNVCEAGKDDCHLADLAKKKKIKSDIRNNITQLSTNKLPNGTNSSIDEYFDRKDLVFSEFTACFTPDRNINESVNSEDIPLKDEADVKDIKLQLDDNLEAQSLFSNDFEMSVTEPDAHDDEGINNGLKPYICHCGLTFKSKDSCKRHMTKLNCDTLMKKKKLGTLLFRCPVCDEQLDTLSDWTAHHHSHDIKITNIKTEKQVTEYFCSLCNRKFKNKKSLRSHIQHHNKKSKITYKCEECKREFKYKAYLDNHILSLHTRDKGFPCQYCTKSFGTEESLNIHKEGHEIEKKHQCSICSKAFLMLCTLKDHMRTHTGEKPFLCSICGKGFSQKNNLAQHMRRHQGLKEFKCETCEKRFISKGELDAHERKHSGAHPFVCDDCNHGFTTSSSLVKHKRIHTGERPYACDLCPMRFAASGTLKNHRRTHTGEKPFQCSHCDKAFVQKSDLISHIRCHTGERPFICTQCGHAFRKAAALKAHVRMHGKDAHLGMQ